MSDCIFCKIISGEVSSIPIRENDQFVAFLDVFPTCDGQTLVVPKHHYDSDIFIMDTMIYSAFMLAVKEVATLLKKGLGVDKVGMVVEGLQVPHAHVKLYPFRGGKSFAGGLTGHTLADMKELQKLADSLLSV